MDEDLRGWVRLYRKLVDSEVFQWPDVLRLFLYCLLNATFRPRFVSVPSGSGRKTIELQPGQLIFGRAMFAQALGRPESTIRNHIEKLAAIGCITIQPDSKYSVLTICEWQTYQVDPVEDGQEKDGSRTGRGQEKDSNRRIKNRKALKNSASQKSLFSDQDIDLARWFFSELRQLHQQFKEPDFDKWADEVRLMRERDGRDHDGIRNVIRFALSDSFWKSKCLSPEKVRKHFDTLTIQAKAKPDGKPTINDSPARVRDQVYDDDDIAARTYGSSGAATGGSPGPAATGTAARDVAG